MIVLEIADRSINLTSKDDDYRMSFNIPMGWKPDLNVNINDGFAYVGAKQMNGEKVVIFTMVPYNINNMPLVIWKDSSKRFGNV